ncbi:rhodanese-like domain-containing protein [Candidatus Nitrosocosmicus sp. T]
MDSKPTEPVVTILYILDLINSSSVSTCLRQVPIYLYSTVGNRADIAADELNKQGFNAFTIKGGFIAWKHEVQGRQNVVKLGKFKEVIDKIQKSKKKWKKNYAPILIRLGLFYHNVKTRLVNNLEQIFLPL